MVLANVLLLTGCWDQRPIEQQAVVIAVGVSPGNRWTFLFPNVAVSIGSLTSLTTSQQFYAVAVQAPTWPEAVARVQSRLDRAVAFGELQLLVLDRRLSTAQVTRVVDALNMNGSVPATVWVVASAVPPETLLLKPSPQTIVPYYYLATYFDCRRCHGLSLGQREWEWWARRQTPGISPLLPLAQPVPGGVDIHQVAVYPPAGPPHVMPTAVTQGWAFLTGRVRHTVLPVTVAGQHFVVSRLVDRTRTRVRLTRRALYARARIIVSGVITVAPPERVLHRREELRLQAAVAAAIRQRCLAALAWANHTHTDPFGWAKQGAWLNDPLARSFSPEQLVAMPKRATVQVTVQLSGEGVVR